jgi:hypothetical protein
VRGKSIVINALLGEAPELSGGHEIEDLFMQLILSPGARSALDLIEDGLLKSRHRASSRRSR